MELKFDPKKVLVVDIHDVRPNTWNPKVADTPEFEKIKRGLKSVGQRMPIVVREKEGDTKSEIVDGEQRFTALWELDYDKVIIYNEGEMSDEEAKALTIWYEQQVPFEDVSLAKLVKELSELKVDLPYIGDELQHLVDLADFDMSQYSPDRPEDEEDNPNVKTLNMKLSKEAFEIVMKAINKVAKDNEVGDARALELICADFLAGQ